MIMLDVKQLSKLYFETANRDLVSGLNSYEIEYVIVEELLFEERGLVIQDFQGIQDGILNIVPSDPILAASFVQITDMPGFWSKDQHNFLMNYPAIARGEFNDTIGHWDLYQMKIFPDRIGLSFSDSSGHRDYEISIESMKGALCFSTKDKAEKTLQLCAGFDSSTQQCEVTIQRQTPNPVNAYEEVLFQLFYNDDHAVVCKSFYPKQLFTYEVAEKLMTHTLSQSYCYDYTEF